MKHYILAICLLLFSSQLWAEESKFHNLVLSKAPIDRTDMVSIKRGGQFFAANCISCHTMKYLRYDKVAEEVGVTYDKMPFNVKIWPNGITPPDLSLEANVRGVDWIYTYLHSFYIDKDRPSGINNLLVANTGMSNILGPYQGEQVLLKNPGSAGVYNHEYEWFNYLELMKDGSMTPEEFNQITIDITNWLAYASEPYYIQQHSLGKWVLGFLLLFTIMAYFLKKEYWKDVKRKD